MGSKYWSEFVDSLVPYVPGEQSTANLQVKLNTNENPYPPSPRVLEAIRAAAGEELRLYPPPNADPLKAAIADYYRVPLDHIFVGNGSDEVLAHTFNGLFRQAEPVLFADITYSFYPVYCDLYDITYRSVPLADDFSLRVEDYYQVNGGIILANPNAPTGRLLGVDRIERLLTHNTESVVVVDEAYVDFGGESAIPLVARHPQLLVIQTLSKSRALAGLRVGFAIGSPELIEGLERVKNSFNSYPLGRLAIAGGAAAMADRAYFERTCETIVRDREVLARGLAALGFAVVPSAANFVFARHPQHDGATLAADLRARGIIVRHFAKPRIDQFLRITIGSPQQHDSLLAALAELVS
ncbi:MAG: histidinol-phosphate transaminase [Porticoccaceae bacterium]